MPRMLEASVSFPVLFHYWHIKHLIQCMCAKCLIIDSHVVTVIESVQLYSQYRLTEMLISLQAVQYAAATGCCRGFGLELHWKPWENREAEDFKCRELIRNDVLLTALFVQNYRDHIRRDKRADLAINSTSCCLGWDGTQAQMFGLHAKYTPAHFLSTADYHNNYQMCFFQSLSQRI